MAMATVELGERRARIATVLAFIIAPVVPVAVMGSLTPPQPGEWVTFFGIGAIVYFFAATYMLIVGLPAYHFFMKRNLMRWWTVPIVGIFAGTLIGCGYRVPFYPDRYQSGMIQGIGCGLAGLVFSVIWRLGQKSA